MKNQNQEALEILRTNENTKIEYLLRLHVMNVDDIAETIEFISRYLWLEDNITIAYQGKGMYKDNLSELYFRSDKPIDAKYMDELMLELSCELGDLFFGYDHKSMVISEFDEVYEDLEEYYDVYGVQNVYHYTDEDMVNIFGEHAQAFTV